jgi:hypothetical protein
MRREEVQPGPREEELSTLPRYATPPTVSLRLKLANA